MLLSHRSYSILRFTGSVNKKVLTTSYVPDTVLGAWHQAEDMISELRWLTVCLLRETKNAQKYFQGVMRKQMVAATP